MEAPIVSTPKCHLTPEGRGLISCPSCGFGRSVDFSENVPPSRNVIVRCKCGRHFKTFLEVRQHYRKRVELLGKYTNMTARRSGQVIVENLSQTGIGLRVMRVAYFETEDLLKITFELDNGKNSLVVVKGAVKHFRANFLGCRIVEISEGQKELQFYLLR